MSQMQKELNPNLFADFGGQGAGGTNNGRVVEPVQSSSARVLEDKIAETRTQVYQIAEQMNRMVLQINEYIKSSEKKFETLNAAIQQLEANDHALNKEAAQKISQIHMRMGDQKTTEHKVVEMMDRHNSVLKVFETRLAHLQKLLAEKDAQLVTAQAALNETRMDLARLKRL